MRRRRFVAAMHEEFGNLGLAPTWMSDGQRDPLTGMGVAHDILEHGSRDVCEWQGLGGAVYVRAGTGYFASRRGNPDPADNLSAEFTNLYGLWDGGLIPDPGPTRACDGDEVIDATLREAVKELGPDATREWLTDENRRRMRGWMRRGYRAAARRWPNAYMAMETFRAIEAAVDRLLDHGDVVEGVPVDILFDAARARVEVQVVMEEELSMVKPQSRYYDTVEQFEPGDFVHDMHDGMSGLAKRFEILEYISWEAPAVFPHPNKELRVLGPSIGVSYEGADGKQGIVCGFNYDNRSCGLVVLGNKEKS